jgi:hypothetical protein
MLVVEKHVVTTSQAARAGSAVSSAEASRTSRPGAPERGQVHLGLLQGLGMLAKHDERMRDLGGERAHEPPECRRLAGIAAGWAKKPTTGRPSVTPGAARDARAERGHSRAA